MREKEAPVEEKIEEDPAPPVDDSAPTELESKEMATPQIEEVYNKEEVNDQPQEQTAEVADEEEPPKNEDDGFMTYVMIGAAVVVLGGAMAYKMTGSSN